MERLSGEPSHIAAEASRLLRINQTGEALWYEVLGIPPRQSTWRRITPAHLRHGKDEAIAEARRLLDSGQLAAASVNGRGTPARPTPTSEVVVYRGVAPTYSDTAFFGMAMAAGKAVERRH